MSKLPDEAFREYLTAIDDEGNRKFIFLKTFWVDFMNIENGLDIFIN
jgi:hypothetical protein